MKIRKLLIANRGEIARRIQRTCNRMGIQTVAVYSDADKDAPFVLEADESYPLGRSESLHSYLNQTRVLEIARVSKVDAIHPGYGFLSENSEFAKKVRDAGILFIGPSAESIELMGDKISARLAMERSGVPVVPGFSSDSLDPEVYQTEARKIGYPVMIKATAGGGGKGMRKVDRDEEFRSGFESAVREAEKAFGNGKIFLEKYIESPRHIEFQIFGDAFGNVIHIHERDCSIQRRHQKILEETPAPQLPAELKERMGEAAICCAASIGYLGAGTVEFILGSDGSFYFLEMNTRLQVEHPVTEMVTGLDLVELQIRIAEGEELPESLRTGGGIPQNGHSIEVRIYAEDPENGFLPSTGKIYWLRCPKMEGIRWDSGVESGSEVSIYYDPMIGKLIAHGRDREDCRRKLLQALENLVLFGPKTNIGFLQRLIQEEDFFLGRVSTHFLGGREHLFDSEKGMLKEAAALAASLTLLEGKAGSIWRIVGNEISA